MWNENGTGLSNKKDVCRKCGIDYEECKCVKFADKDSGSVTVEADLVEIIFTNRVADTSEKIKFFLESPLE